VIADCLPRARDRDIELVGDCPPGLEADVNAPLLEQALINLVDNAIKFSEPGRRIWISAATDAAATTPPLLSLAVRDEGCGIEAEHLPRLFERFYRIDRGRSRRLGGTGLGLSIVKHIAQAHGGTVAVESQPGVGSEFTLRLPLRAAV
jgi:two-component system phosphate regulon sensor histidine kinase PhoR